jgi:hypothetical protein
MWASLFGWKRTVCWNTYSSECPNGSIKASDDKVANWPETAVKYGRRMVSATLRNTLQCLHYTVINLKLKNSRVVTIKLSPYYGHRVKKAYRGNGDDNSRSNFENKRRREVSFILWSNRCSLGIKPPVITGQKPGHTPESLWTWRRKEKRNFSKLSPPVQHAVCHFTWINLLLVNFWLNENKLHELNFIYSLIDFTGLQRGLHIWCRGFFLACD